MPSVTFDGVATANDAGGMSVEVPLDVRALFGQARPPVVASINGHSWRTTVAVYGGVSYVGISREHRTAAGIAAGDTLTVTIASDGEPRSVDVPADLAEALNASPDARARFDAMPYTHRLEYARWIAEAKRPETRARRIPQAIERILAGRPSG